MQKSLLGLALFFSLRSFAQCPFTVNLTSSTICPGATLGAYTAITAGSPAKIVWYENGAAVSTVTATSSFNPNGITVAGIGGGGPGANQLDFPQGFYIDAAGDIYISDEDNFRIVKYAPGSTTGVTVAGGNGFGAAANQLNGAADVYVDASGNIYISDYGNFWVQKWAPGASAGVTVAGGNGSGSAANQFDFPVGMYVDAAGNIYVADIYNQRVQKWTPGASTGITVAGGNGPGSAANQFLYPTDVFVDAAGNIYVVDDGNNRVQKWASGASSGVTVAGGNGVGSAANQLNSPYGVYVDANGDVFVGDAVNNRVQEWLPGATTGITVAGGNGPGVDANQMTDPRFVRLDGNGNLYVSEDEDNRVQEFTVQSSINNLYTAPTPGVYTAVVTNAAGCTATSNAFGIEGPLTPTVSITASANPVYSCTEVTFSAAVTGGGSLTTFQWQVNGANVGINEPIFQTSVSDGDIVDCVLTAVDTCAFSTSVPSNGLLMSVLGLPSVTLSDKGRNCTGDTLVISSSDSLGQIVWMDNSATVSTVLGTTSRSALTVAGGNGQGNAANQLFAPFGVSVDASGNVYVNDFGNYRVQKWAPGATTGVNVAGGLGDEELSPTGISVDAAGDVYVVEALYDVVQKYPPGATQGIDVAGGNGAGGGSGANQLNDPTCVYVDAAGNVYVGDYGNYRVQKWAPGATSGVTVAGGNGPGKATNQCYPLAVFADAAGNVYVNDGGNDRIQKWAPGATSGVTLIQGVDLGAPELQGLWVDGAGDIFVLNRLTNSVVEYPPGNTRGIIVAGGTGAGSAANQLNGPDVVYVDAQGDIYVSDGQNNRVQEFMPRPSIDSIYKTLAGGSYTAAVTTSGGCVIDVGPIVVNQSVNPAVTISANATEVCSNTAVSFTAVPVNGGTTMSYQWLVNGVNAGGNSPSFTSSALSGDAQVSCVMTGNAVCATQPSVSSNVVAVQVDPPVTPSVSISAAADNICAGTTANFTAVPLNGGTAPGYQWMVNGVDAGGNSAVFSTSNLADGSVVSCALTGSALCATTGTAQSNVITMHVNPVVVPVVAVTPSVNPICFGAEVSFSAVAGGAGSLNYQWQVNGVNVGVDSPGYSTAGLNNGDEVLCEVSSGAVCVATVSDSVAMVVNPTPVIPPGQVFADESGGVLLQPQVTGDIGSYTWTPATGLSADNIDDPFATPAASTVYTLSVVSTAGCKASGEITVKVYTDIRIPNGFTPNGDGHNDVFYVMGGPTGSLIKDFSVYDRWGLRVFQVHDVASGDPAFGWNGTYKGNEVPPGTYVYVLTMSLAGGTAETYKGTVILIR